MTEENHISGIHRFSEERSELNELALKNANLGIKRFLNLDSQAYEDGVLPKKTKEMLGLVASLVLRCDDCINYHIIECKKAGATDDEFTEVMNIGLIVGGSIVIPHLRRAYKSWEELKQD